MYIEYLYKSNKKELLKAIIIVKKKKSNFIYIYTFTNYNIMHVLQTIPYHTLTITITLLANLYLFIQLRISLGNQTYILNPSLI